MSAAPIDETDLPRPLSAQVRFGALAAALVLLGLSLTLYKIHFPPGPVADEATYVMMAQSLWHDLDLQYEAQDLERAYQLWDHGPHGMILFTTNGGDTMFYGKPYVYGLAAVPFYALFGAQGLIVLNMVLLLAMVATAWWVLRRERGWVLLWVGGFFFLSVIYSYVFWMQPEVLNMACVFFPLAIWLEIRRKEHWTWKEHVLLALAGACLACAFVSKEPTVLMGAPIAGDLMLRRRWSGLLPLALGSLLTLVALVGFQVKETERWSPYRDVQRRSFENSYPLEMAGDPWALYKGTSFGSWNRLPFETNPRVLSRNAGYFIFGRHTGLLPYMPFALFALALFAFGPRDRFRWMLLFSIGGYCLLLFLVRSHNYHGGAGFLGNRYLVSIYPAFLFLPAALRVRKALLVPCVAAALWTVSVIAVPVQQIAGEFGLQVHTRSSTFQALPLELTLLRGGMIPGYWIRGWPGGTWITPRQNFFAREKHPDGVWVRGASDSDIILVSRGERESISLRLQSLSAKNVVTFETEAGTVRVRFDTEEKRQGTPVEIPLGEPVARDLDNFVFDGPERYYRIRLKVSDGMVPQRRDPQSQDLRYLGVFLGWD
ncbi:MAG: hypothetical protein AAGD01_09940 [Acidobacteriota bacterium]